MRRVLQTARETSLKKKGLGYNTGLGLINTASLLQWEYLGTTENGGIHTFYIRSVL